MLLLALGLLFSAPARADEPPLLRGPTKHDWSNHLLLWSTIDDRTRPLSVGHEIMLGPKALERIGRFDDRADVWRPGPEAERRTFSMEHSDTEITVDANGDWTSTMAEIDSTCRFATGSESWLLAIGGQRVTMYVDRFSGYSEYGGPRFETSSASVDLTNLLGSLSDWRFFYYEDSFGRAKSPKIIAMPVADGEADPSRDAYAFVVVLVGEDDVRLLGVRVRLTGPTPTWPFGTPRGTVFKQQPVVSQSRVISHATWVEAGAAAQVGGLIELDHAPPDFLVPVAIKVRSRKLLGALDASNVSLSGLVAATNRKGWFIGASMGYFVDSAFITANAGFTGVIGPREAWIVDARMGLGTGMTLDAGFGRVVRSGRRWDLTLTPRLKIVDVDLATDTSVRFPIYAGFSVGMRQDGVRVVGR